MLLPDESTVSAVHYPKSKYGFLGFHIILLVSCPSMHEPMLDGFFREALISIFAHVSLSKFLSCFIFGTMESWEKVGIEDLSNRHLLNLESLYTYITFPACQMM
ncbi:unnamed protein product [Allacma fusca]|uniref:Uncharacterized protein n=1 Tax=Allacma fusca TaxID=39272 RepID=A0A8J2NX09_9HEXA|nr:unnamed protein product [Allacma fusca]